MNIDKFYAQLAGARLSMEGAAQLIEMDRSTLYRRLQKDGESFTLSEISALVKLLALSDKDILEIFFNR